MDGINCLKRSFRWTVKSVVRTYDSIRILRSKYFVLKYRELRRRARGGGLFIWFGGAALATFLILLARFAIDQGYSAPWTGFGQITDASGAVQRGKTLWDWLDLLVVPFFLALVVYLFARFQRSKERGLAHAHRTSEVLQDYLDRMTELLLVGNLRSAPAHSEVTNIARARTLAVLRDVDPEQKGHVLTFLKEAKLIERSGLVIELRRADLSGLDLIPAQLNLVDLRGVNLSGARLPWSDFYGSNLSGVLLEKADLESAKFTRAEMDYAYLNGADLFGADLQDVSLIKAKLRGANLRWAKLQNAVMRTVDLENTDLRQANLAGAYLKYANLIDADLRGAELTGADLTNATLWGANLSGADLTGADLSDSYVTWKQLRRAKSVRGARLSTKTKM